MSEELPPDAPTEALDEQSGSLLLALIGQLKIGMDLSRVTLPTFVLEPRSLLEKLTDFMSHSPLFIGIPDVEDPEERFLAVVRWYLTGFHVRPKGVKKPYNPIIGETFRCKWDHGAAGGTTHYLAEQVSHHPPISTFVYMNRKKQIFVNGYIYPRSKFLGNSAASIMDGSASLLLLSRGEQYTFSFPSYYARGLLMGKLLMETVGECSITCPQTGYKAEIEFKAKGYFTGEYNAVVAKIKNAKGTTVFNLQGTWDSKITISGGKYNGSVFFEVASTPVHPKVVAPLEQQGDFESQKLWSKVTRALLANDVDTATTHKSELEQRQRDEARDRQAKSQQWKTQHFMPGQGESWNYKAIPSRPYSAQEIAQDPIP
eukprot:TRINITY_DN2956_c0_g1_i1.p1 TRINITY_DN2956_c0_g1~~TRINITY_DN2956_c0_g1_i1.p1  ORF type:complete len:382 (+),score=78.51 TRINITY_DN2956_c0_g1_i1:32-1147(+)